MTPTDTPPPTGPFDAERLARLREVAQAATPGPWSVNAIERGSFFIETDESREAGEYPAAEVGSLPDATHIATFDPLTVLALLDEGERLARIAESERSLAGHIANRAVPVVQTFRAERDAARSEVERLRAKIDQAAWAGCCGECDAVRAESERDEARADLAAAREQIEIDRAMHEAYRPEVVAEVAVNLSDDSDWDAVAKWCGGTIHTSQDPSGEYTSSIEIPGVGDAWQGSWIVQRHDLSFAIRAEVAGPSEWSAETLRGLAAAQATIARVRALGDEFEGAIPGFVKRLRAALDGGEGA